MDEEVEVFIRVTIPFSAHQALKILAVKQQMSIKQIGQKALLDYLLRNKAWEEEPIKS